MSEMKSVASARSPEILAKGEVTLVELGSRIKSAHEQLVTSARSIVFHAIEIGKDLMKAQALGGYGNWGRWLEANCALNERTAQRYMELARGEATLREKLITSDTMSELTLKKAKQLIDAGSGSGSGTGTGGNGEGSNPADNYDKVEVKLIEKLDAIVSLVTAEAAAQETINKLVERVRIKSGGKHSLKIK
jgi:Protein of unknown function (DUF3102)